MSTQLISSSSKASSLVSNLHFSMIGKNSAYFDLLVKVFNEKIKPYYGDQQSIISMIKNNTGRRAEALVDGKEAVGLLVYRDELRKLNDGKHSLEITALTVIDDKYQGKGYGKALLDRAIEKCRRRDADGMHVYVEKTLKAAASFFRKAGFIELDSNGPDFFMYRSLSDKAPVSNKRKLDLMNSSGSSQSSSSQKATRIGEGDFMRQETKIEEEKSSSNTARSDFHPMSYPRERLRIIPSMSDGLNPPRLHQITLPKKYIQYIRMGVKPVEGRVFKGFVNNLREGQNIRFFYTQNAQDDVTCRITKIQRYNSFPEMVKACGYKKCVPDVSSEEAAIDAYHKIPGYLENSKIYGVAAIFLEVLGTAKGS